VNLRPGGNHPERALVVAGLPRVAAILDRIAAGIDELARARRVGDLAAAVLPGRRAERRRRVAEPDLDFREFCRRQKVPASSERSWDAYEAERYRRGERHPSRLHREPVPYRPPAGVTHSGAETAPVLFPCGSSVRQQDVQQSGHFGGVHGVVLTDTPKPRRGPTSREPGSPAIPRAGSGASREIREPSRGSLARACPAGRTRRRLIQRSALRGVPARCRTERGTLRSGRKRPTTRGGRPKVTEGPRSR